MTSEEKKTLLNALDFIEKIAKHYLEKPAWVNKRILTRTERLRKAIETEVGIREEVKTPTIRPQSSKEGEEMFARFHFLKGI